MPNTSDNMSEGFLFSLKVPMMYLHGFDELSDRQIVYFPLFLPDVINILFLSFLFISVIFSQLRLLDVAMPEFSTLEAIELYIPSLEAAHFANTLLLAPSCTNVKVVVKIKGMIIFNI